MAAFDPKMLLAPKTANKQSSVPPSRSLANEFQPGPQRASSADAFPNGLANGGHPSSEGPSLIERKHNVQRREDAVPKRRKLNDTGENEVGMKKLDQQHGRVGGSGELGGYFKEKKQEANAQQGATSTTIDLTTEKDDDDLVVVQDNMDREVCVGKIDGARVNAHRIPANKSGFVTTQKMWPPQKVTLSRRPGSNTHIIGVADVTNKDFGTIDVKTASVLAPLMDCIRTSKIRVYSRLDPRPRKPWEQQGQSVSDHYSITLVLYCPFRMVNGIGRAFSQRQIWLRDPQSVAPGVELVNPHTVKDYTPQKKTLAATTSRYTGSIQLQRTQEEVRQDVFRIFDSLKQTDELPQENQPKLIRTPLLSHQKQALHFMKEREKDKRYDVDAEDESSLWQKQETRGKVSWYHVITGHETSEEPEPVLGGILADVMGLGKTLNVLSLVCDTRDEGHKFSKGQPPKPKFEGDRDDVAYNSRATLLVCPLSTVANWEEQIKQHVRHVNPKFTYLIHHGQSRTNDPEELTDYDLVISTYPTVAYDAEKRSAKRPQDPLGETNWFRIVLDEAHTIRGQQTRQSKAICALYGERRWAVTGTPVQNRLEDLGALMKFLRIRPFDDPRNFAQHIIAPFKTADTEIIPKLRLLVDSITLRRLKDKIDLPKREEVTERLDMNDQEREFYDYFARESSKNISAMTAQEKLGGKAYAHVLKAIMRMRLLAAGGPDLLNDEDWDAAQGFSANSAIDLEEINVKPERSARQAFELYRMMMDANVNSCVVCNRIIQHKEIKDVESDDEGDEDDEEPSDHIFGYLAQCNQLICPNCIDSFKQQCYSVAGTDNFGHCPKCETYTKFAFFTMTQNEYEADELAIREVRNNPKMAKRAGRYSGPSPKTRALIHALECDLVESQELMQKGQAPIKSVIFSGWTSHLDLIQLALVNSKIHFVRLDGSMRRKQRADVLQAFQDNPDVTCILISIAAGGLGLNLTAASRVFLMEPQFNPASEDQAIERVHRLGQKREVIITKYIMNKSFEEKMLLLQQKKKALADMSMEKSMKYDKQDKAKKLMEDLRTLFK